MPQLYAEVLRSVAFRDNNAKPQGDNNPATSNTSWFADAGFGGTKNSDGDILKVTGTDATHGVYRNCTGNPSTTTYPYVVVRAYADSAQTIQVQVNELSGLSDSFTISLTSSPTTFSLKTTSGRQYSATQTVRILNQSGGGTLYIDYVYGCGQPPVQLSQRDLSSGTIIRTALGADTAQLTVNNWRGKFVAGSSSSIALSFGDHLHIYLGQGPTALHVFGGYVEQQDAVMPPDRMIISGRGFGIALLRAKMLNSYSNQTPRQIINDVVDNQVNASNKNGLGIASNYQLTRSYVQDLGSSIPLYLANMLPAYNVLREICDLTVSQESPSIFFVDPAENLHFVPLGTQGSANWSTDPFPATYAGTLAIGKNLSVVQVPRDTMSVVNRVHYYAISQTPGLLDAWTEYSTNAAVAANWGSERLNAGPTTVTWNSVTAPVALGAYAVNAHLVNPVNGCGAALFYPSGKNLGLDIGSLGSAQSPPLFEFYFRAHNPNGGYLYAAPDTIFFANDSTNRFEYRFVSENGAPANSSILNFISGNPGGQNFQQDFWYHILLPIGPHGGTQFSNPPLPNTIATASYTGTSGYQLANVGTPSWSNINYIGFEYASVGPIGGETADFYFDGWRILGGRYRIAYDNRASRYPDMSEQFYYDPVSKDETAIKNFAKAELLRLRNPILRGPLTTPLLADLYPEQQVAVTIPSANFNNTYLRVTQVAHRFSANGFLTEVSLSDDFTNSQPLEQWKLVNALLEMGENAYFSRQLADLKSATLDSTFVPLLDPHS